MIFVRWQSTRTAYPSRAVIAGLMSILPDAIIWLIRYALPYFSAPYQGACGPPVYHQPGARGLYSLAAAMGAQVGQPDAAVLSVMGDGSFGFSCGELETLVRYNLPVKAIVFFASYGWIKLIKFWL